MGSYIKGPKSPHLFTLTRRDAERMTGEHDLRALQSPHRSSLLAVYFLLHFPCSPHRRSEERSLRRWALPTTAVLWSPDFPLPAIAVRTATVQPAREPVLIVSEPNRLFSTIMNIKVVRGTERFGVGMGLLRFEWGSDLPADCRHGVACIGNFDGVHRGHCALLGEAKRLSERTGGPVVAVTFDPHPIHLLSPDREQPPLTTVEERARLLCTVGADRVLVLHTTPEVLQVTPKSFFDGLLVRALSVRGLVEGYNFRFGHDRAGSNDMLRESSANAGIEFVEVGAVKWLGEPVSSSKVRHAIEAGDITRANDLLGRYYFVSGMVGTGAQRGRTIGFPTANLEEVITVIPAEGVYAARAWVGDRPHPAAANIGPNPTFGEFARKLEVHLIDFTGDLYGQKLRVEFLSRLSRDNQVRLFG